jgi:hypothetical protein
MDLRFFDSAKQALVVFDGDSRTYIPGPWQRTQYAAVGNWLWYINGFEEPRRWDGRHVVRVGFDRPPPPPSIDDPNSGLDIFDQFGREGPGATFYARQEQRGLGDRPVPVGALNPVVFAWKYAYAITWLNDLGQESPPSSLVFASGENTIEFLPGATTNGKMSALVRIPDAPSHVHGIRVYRTRQLLLDNQSGGATTIERRVEEQTPVGQLFFHSEWATGKGFSLIDDKPDQELGALLDPDRTGLLPRGVKYLAPWQGCMFVGGSPEHPDRVWFSAPGLPEQFPALNYIDLGNRDSGEVTGIYPTKNVLVVFKRRGTFIIRGDPARGFEAQTLSPDVGCSSPNALQEAPGLGLVFVSESGVFLLEGATREHGHPTRITRISGPIQKVWNQRVNTAALMSAQGVLYRRQREIWLQVPADGASATGHMLGLVYHYELGTWSLRPDWPINCFTESKDERGYLFFGGRLDRGVYAYSRGRDKGGVAVVAKYQTAWQDLGSVWGRSQVLYASPYLLNYGDRTHTLAYRRDRRVAFGLTEAARKTEDAEQARPKWGAALWGSKTVAGDRWSDYDPTVIRHDVTDENGHLGMNTLEWQTEMTSTRLGLVSYALGVPPTKEHDIHKLTDVLSPAKR